MKEQVIKWVKEYLDREYGYSTIDDEADIGMGYTEFETVTGEMIPVQVTLNLEEKSITKEIDWKIKDCVKCDSYKELLDLLIILDEEYMLDINDYYDLI